MIINVRYVLLLAFRGLLLSLKLNLNSKTLSMSYFNSSIFFAVQCYSTGLAGHAWAENQTGSFPPHFYPIASTAFCSPDFSYRCQACR